MCIRDRSGITEWIHNWKKNGWKTANKKEVSNKALWPELDLLNNEVDLLARHAAKL